jgi:hypothetical protein
VSGASKGAAGSVGGARKGGGRRRETIESGEFSLPNPGGGADLLESASLVGAMSSSAHLLSTVKKGAWKTRRREPPADGRGICWLVSWQVLEPGRCYGLIGRNGKGKSTLLCVHPSLGLL